MFPFEIDFDNAIKGDLSDVTEEYPWVEIECEMIQSMDPDIICMLELNVTERDCNNTNLIRVYNAFKGDTLVYTEPDITQQFPREPAIIPPWLNNNQVPILRENIYYIDGEYYDLNDYEIRKGDKSEEDLDLN